MFATRTTTALLALPLTVVLTAGGCGSKKTAASPAAPTHPSAASAGSGTSSHSSNAGVTSKNCPAGDTRATINGVAKCLAAGQQCSSKAISQYTQYGFVCRKQANGYLLSRT